MRAAPLLAALAMLAGCSFTTASGLEECRTSADCTALKQSDSYVCSEGFCLPQPTGCGQRFGSSSSNAIALGALMPLAASTEPDAGVDASDQAALNAAVLALEEANQRGLGSRQLALFMCDTAGVAERARTQADWLVKEKRVAAVLTAGSQQTLAAASVTLPGGVLTLSYSASSPELTRLPDTHSGSLGLLWRTSPSDVIQGRVVGDLLLYDSRFNSRPRVAILSVNDPYGQGLTTLILERFNAAGSARERRSFFYTRREDPSALLAQLDSYDPDLTVLIAFQDDASRILKQAASMANLNPSVHQWLFTDSVKDVALLADAAVREQINGTYGTAPAQGAGLAFGNFRDRFLTRYSEDPALYAYTANAYDAMFLLAAASAYAHSTQGVVTGAKLAEAFTRVSAGPTYQLTASNFTTLVAELVSGRSVNVEGASGKLDFNDDGDVSAPVELWQVDGSTFRTVTTLDATP